MNERIEELYKQSFIEVQDENSFPCMTFSKQKFAELIVGECVATIANDTANYPGEGMMAYYQGVRDSARAIKKHFGVE